MSEFAFDTYTYDPLRYAILQEKPDLEVQVHGKTNQLFDTMKRYVRAKSASTTLTLGGVTYKVITRRVA